MMSMVDAPIAMLQWLKSGEYRETRTVLAEFAGKTLSVRAGRGRCDQYSVR